MSDTDKQIEKIVKELLDLKKLVEKAQKDLKEHIDLYNDHIRKLHIKR